MIKIPTVRPTHSTSVLNPCSKINPSLPRSILEVKNWTNLTIKVLPCSKTLGLILQLGFDQFDPFSSYFISFPHTNTQKLRERDRGDFGGLWEIQTLDLRFGPRFMIFIFSIIFFILRSTIQRWRKARVCGVLGGYPSILQSNTQNHVIKLYLRWE